MKFCIYAMIDPRNKEIFYIGRTNDIGRRCAEHFEGTHQLSGLTVRQIKEAGFLPHVAVLEHCKTLDQACMSEIFWLECMKARGAKLTNAQGFSGYVERSKERARQSRQLDDMRRTKSLSQTLQDVSNGVPARAGAEWTKRDLARLKGMRRSNFSPEFMADALERPLSDIKAKLKSIAGKSKRTRRTA